MYYLQDADYETAAQNGISRSALYNRVYSYGWSIKRAITEPARKRCKLRAKYAQLAVENGISRPVFYERISNGWSLEQAATVLQLSREESIKRANEANRKVLTESQVETARLNGISIATARARVKAYGWDVQRAITEPVKVQFRSRKVD